MKLYSDSTKTAPSPRRVRMFLSEKHIEVDVVAMALHEDNRTEAFRRKNPIGTLPVLELDDGTCIAESLAICRYFEAESPEPVLFGVSPLQIATIEMWNRRAELNFYLPIEYAGGFLGAEVADRARKNVDKMLNLFDANLAQHEFLAGKEFSVADITAKVAIDFGVRYNDIVVPESYPHFRRWSDQMGARPSAAA